ncbi:MAG: hypothetical protein ILP16_09745 [Spirochaetales bacterium]|nr:hypothetical protein [Spirochaetales bacterium]
MSTNQIWLTLEGDQASSFQIPMNPESYTYTQGTNDKLVSRINAESATIKQGAAPRQLSFSSVFPSGASANLEVAPSQLKTPQQYDALMRAFKESDKRILVTITGTNINEYFRITNYKTEEQGGDVGSIYYTVTFRSAQKIKIKKVSGISLGTGYDAGTRTIKAKKGDTWKKIAAREYGSSSKANVKKLKKANGNKKKPKKGQTVIIPD